jgi:uncharacterized membrane protein
VRDRLFNRWVTFRGSFWFIPTLMTACAIALAFGTVAIDHAVDWNPDSDSPLGFGGSPDGARVLVSVMAGSTITAAATAFSITIATLVLASQQFGPRLLRNFISDTGIQVVLGTFIGTFAYSLVILRAMQTTDSGEFVPQVSITIAFLLSLTTIMMLIYFIHHVATSIQVTSIIRSVSRDLEGSIDRLYKVPEPEKPDEDLSDEPERDRESVKLDDDEAAEVASRHSGYIQTIDIGRILQAAGAWDVMIKLRYHAGAFILHRATIALVWPEERADDDLAAEINAALKVGNIRTPTQDVEFAIDQLVEIAVRALSPGVNDPFTAIACTDRLASALVRIVERRFPDPLHRDGDGRLRVIAAYAGFGAIVDAAFNQIRHHGRENPAILMHILETIAVVARRTENEDQRDALLRHAKMIHRAAQALDSEHDRDEVADRYREVLHALHRVREEEGE